MDYHNALQFLQTFVTLLAAIGTAIKSIMERYAQPSNTINIGGSIYEGPVTFNSIAVNTSALDLTPESVGLTDDVERVIRTVAPAGEPPAGFWLRVNIGLVIQNGSKFRSMIELGASNEAIGLEALMQAIPEDRSLTEAVRRVVNAYLATRTLNLDLDHPQGVGRSPSFLLDTFRWMAHEVPGTGAESRQQDLKAYGSARLDVKKADQDGSDA